MRIARTLLLIGPLGLWTAPAFAADAVSPFPEARVAEPPAAPPVEIWSGPYAGTFVGYNVSNFDDLAGASLHGEGFVGGVYGGYNLQSGNLVFGIEADIGGSGFDASDARGAGAQGYSGESNVFGSLRGRAGVALDPFLVYGTAGLAVAESELSRAGFSDSETNLGYTVGAGIEAQVFDNVTTRLEYRYSDYGNADYDLGNTAVSSGFDEHSVRAGVALKF